MGILLLLKRLLLLVQATALVGVICLPEPAIRVREPEFEPLPKKVTHKIGEQARLFCSVKHQGERTVVWRKLPDTNPLTIGAQTWIEDSRISVDRGDVTGQWDLIIDDVTLGDVGQYECQISVSKRLLRHLVQLDVTENVSGQVKRNPEIAITGSQVVPRGDNISLFCKVTTLSNPRHVLVWFRGGQEMQQDEDRVFFTNDSQSSDILTSNLRILNAHTWDSGLYTCGTRDHKLMASAQVSVLTGGSNNVKRAGSSRIHQESAAVIRFHCVVSRPALVLILTLLQMVVTRH